MIFVFLFVCLFTDTLPDTTHPIYFSSKCWFVQVQFVVWLPSQHKIKVKLLPLTYIRSNSTNTHWISIYFYFQWHQIRKEMKLKCHNKILFRRISRLHFDVYDYCCCLHLVLVITCLLASLPAISATTLCIDTLKMYAQRLEQRKAPTCWYILYIRNYI